MAGKANEQAAKLKAFGESWPDTQEMLQAVAKDEREALDFGDKLEMALDALDAGLAILSALGLIDSISITLSGWKDAGKDAVLKYSTSRKLDEEGEYCNTIQKDLTLNEEI